MSLHLNTNNFNGGELSPLVYGRQDLQKYKTSAKELENFQPTKYGPFERSLGFNIVLDSAATPAAVETKGNALCRLERFRFNTSTNYTLAFTNLALRFYKGGATPIQIESSPGVAYEVVTPYLEADLFDLQLRGINDVVYITHPSYAVHKLSRITETSWTIAEIDWDFPPVLDINATSTTITPSGTSGTVSLTASASYFTDDMEGGYFALTHTREAQNLTYGDSNLGANISEGTNTIKIKGPWTLTTAGVWGGTLALSKSNDGGSTWIEVWKSPSDSVANYSVSGTESFDDYEYSLWFTWDSSTTATGASIVLRSEPVDITGFVKLGTYVSGTSFTGCTVKKTLEATAATKLWNEGSFSDERGHPKTCTFHQQRLWFASTSYEKQRVWCSQVGDFENFELGANDDDGIAIDLASDQQNEILWLRSEKRVLAGTAANEWTIGADNLNGAITPANITAKVHTFVGSDEQPAINAGNKFLFLTRNTKRLQSFFYNFQIDGYDSDEISKLSEHITEGGITQMAYQQVRDQIVWMVRGDGQLVGLVFNEEDNVVAFFRRKNDDITFESIATLYGTDEDEVWAVAKATIDSTTKRFIVRLSGRETIKEDMVYLDLARTSTNADLTTSWTASHLPNTTIDVLADGWVQQGITTDGSGNFTISPGASKVTYGLPYTSKYRSLNIEAPTGDGTSKGKKKRITRIDLGVKDSLGGTYGVSRSEAPGNQNVEVTYNRLDRVMGVSLIGGSPDLVTGVFPLTMPEGNYTEVDILIKQEQPLPLTVTHTFPVVNTKGD